MICIKAKVSRTINTEKMIPICYIELNFTILGTNVSKSIFKCIISDTFLCIFRILFDKISIYKSAFSVQKGLNKKLLLLKAQSTILFVRDS